MAGKNIELEKFTCEKFIIRGGEVIFFYKALKFMKLYQKGTNKCLKTPIVTQKHDQNFE